MYNVNKKFNVKNTRQGPCVSDDRSQQQQITPIISQGGQVTFYKQSYYIRPLEFEMDHFLNRGKVAFWVPKEKGDTINLFSLHGSSMLDSSLITKVTLYVGGHPLHTIDGWLLTKNFYDGYNLPFTNAPLYAFMMDKDQIVIEIEYIADHSSDNTGSFVNPKDLRVKVQYGTLEPRVRQELKRNMDLGLGNQLITMVDQKKIQITYMNQCMYWTYPHVQQQQSSYEIAVNYPYGLKMHDPTKNWSELEQHSKLPQPY